jgi:hypothetical protein
MKVCHSRQTPVFIPVFILYYFVGGRSLGCSFDEANRKYFRTFIAIFGNVGRFASEEVILSLIRAKCRPKAYLLHAVGAIEL